MVRFSTVEKQVMEDVFDPEMMKRTVPGLEDVVEGAAMVRSMLNEANVLGRYQKANGFSKDRTMQRVACLNTTIMRMIEQLHEAGCTCGRGLWGAKGHSQWFYEWLSKYGKQFDVRGKVVP